MLPLCSLILGCMSVPAFPAHAEGLEALPGLRMDVEWRHRAEARNNADFDSSRDDNQSGYLSRFRLGVEARPVPGLRAYVQVQDARRVGDLTQRVTNVTTLHQGFLEIPVPKEGGLGLRVGRQQIFFGERRLVSESNWGNSGRTFDAIRLTHRTKSHTVDYFSANVVTHNYLAAPVPAQGSFHGVYATWGGGKQSVKDLYALAKYRGGGMWTVGGRVRTPEAPGRVDLMGEFAWQMGRQAYRRVKAHAGIVSAGYTFRAPWSPRIGLEHAYSPGDRTPDDAVTESFDILYPTDHPYYGIMDYAVWRNLRNSRVSLSVKPSARLRVGLDYHNFRLAAAEDAWYAPGKILQDKSGASGTQLGNELDVQIDYKLGQRVALSAGYGRFFAGSYITRQKPAAADSDWGYLQTTFTY